MQIRVKSLQGEEYVVQVQNDQLVSSLKANICEIADGLSVDRQKLVYKGRTMQDSSLIGEYNLEEDCKVHLMVQREASHKNTSIHSASTSSCPMDTSQQAEPGCDNSKLQERFGDNPQASKSPASRFEIMLRERLSRIYSPAHIERILAHINREIDEDISCSSLDDLERLAKLKLDSTDD